MNSKAQVSLESLLIWAALAGMLALLTPAFAQLMHAYALQQETLSLKAHAQQVEIILQELSFESQGSVRTYSWTLSPSIELIVDDLQLEFHLNDASLSSPKIFVAESFIPLLYAPSLASTKLIFLRTAEGITIQSE